MKFARNKLLCAATYFYLYLPIYIFLLSWVKPFWSVPLSIMAACSIYNVIKKDRSVFHMSGYIPCMAALIIIIVWCIISGIGGYAFQTSDWSKHNVLLQTLVTSNWPVKVSWNSMNGTLCYYIAYYLFPAAVGKLFGGKIEVAYQTTLIWSIIGICLIVLNIQKSFRKRKNYEALLIILGIIFFAAFTGPMTGIYRNWNPTDAADGSYWLSQSIFVQYSSNITNMRFVFSQFIPVALETVMLVNHKEDSYHWGIICAPSILYSAFCFITFCGILALVFLQNIIKGKMNLRKEMKNILSVPNITAYFLVIILFLYLAPNILQDKPDAACMSFKFVDYRINRIGFVLIEFSWFAWILLLLKNRHLDSCLIAASICLFVLSLFSYGKFNDLCMRGSIPALMIINIYVVNELMEFIYEKTDKWYMCLLLICLIISGSSSLGNLYHDVVTYGISKNYRDERYDSITDFMNAGTHISYQYVTWGENKILEIILQ